MPCPYTAGAIIIVFGASYSVGGHLYSAYSVTVHLIPSGSEVLRELKPPE
jgi:hypothetical protein